MPKYSIIIPVFNRPDEMSEMLDSLDAQTRKEFELLIIEDGSTQKSDHLIEKYDLDIKYFFKENSGPGDSRNFGMDKAKGEWLLFFDSDCILPSDYFENLDEGLLELSPDAFGGPDGAHDSFTTVQKAINYSMTSFFTTGGIRGGKKQLDKYQPRSFNMGVRRRVFEDVGGFKDIHPGEDPDWSYRIMDAGYKVSLISKAIVYHKRRIDFSKFAKQVYKFGVVRGILNRWHPGSGKLVYTLPSFFLLGVLSIIVGSFIVSPTLLYFLIFYACLVIMGSMLSKNSLFVSLLAVPAAFVQLLGYGFGYLLSFWKLRILGRNERKAFPSFFYK
ncbi:MAG: glycosyltransferase [Reichenbachiella sp.]